jgi:predicted PurR-regulated permease PerM
MHNISVNLFQKRALGVFTALAVLFGMYFLWSFFLLIAFAAIVAFSFNPLYKRLLRRWNKPGTAATITLLATFLALLIPLVLVLALTVHEVTILVDKVSNANLNDLELSTITKVNRFLDNFNISFVLTQDWIRENAQKLISSFGSEVLKSLTGFLGNFFSLFASAIIYIFVFMALLLKQEKIKDIIRGLNPLGDSIGDLYIRRVTAMLKGTVRGQFTIAIAQGFIDAGLLYVAGLHDLFFFFFVLLTALSVIPLGGGIVALPIGVAMILTGNIAGGILVIAGHIFIVTNIDNVLRPKLVPKVARLDSALMLLAVFSGIRFFGFLGIVIGPVIMILISTTIQVYLEVYKGAERVIDENELAKKRLHEKLLFQKSSNESITDTTNKID